MAMNLISKLFLDAKGFSGGVKVANEDMLKLQAQARETGAAVENLGNSIGNGLFKKLNGIKQQFSNFSAGIKGIASMFTPVTAGLTLAGAAAVGTAVAFVKYNNSIQEATRLTREFTGVTGNELSAVRDKIMSVSDTFGKDFKEVLSSVDGVMSQWGLSAEEATNIIKDGFVAGSDLSGDFLSKLNRFAPSFRDAGISAKEMVALIAQTRSGLFNDAGLQAIATASKKLREMATTTSESLKAIGIDSTKLSQDLSQGIITPMQAIQKVSAAMRQYGANSKEVGDVIKNVFGKQGTEAGLEVLATFDKISTSLEEVKKQTGEYGELQDKLTKTNEEYNNALSRLFEVQNGGWENGKKRLEIFWKQGLTKCIEFVVKLKNAFINGWNELSIVRKGVGAVFSMMVLQINQVIALVKTLGNAFYGLGQMLQGDFKKGWDTMKDAVVKGVEDSIESYKKAIQAYDDVANSHITPSTGDYTTTTGGGKENVFGTGGSTGNKAGNKPAGTKTAKTKEEKIYLKGSIGYLDQEIKKLGDAYLAATDDISRGIIKAQIDELENEKKRLKGETEKVEVQPVLKEGTIAYYKDMLSDLQAEMEVTTKEDGLDEIIAKIKTIQGIINELNGTDVEVKTTKSVSEMEKLQGEISGVGSTFNSFGSILQNTEDENAQMVGTMLSGFGQIAEGIAKLIPILLSESIAEGTAKVAATSKTWYEILPGIASVTAGIIAAFSQMAKFENGGIVGGNSFTGDRVLVRANSGEMILNKQQQASLYNQLNDNNNYRRNNIAQVEFKISGTNLIGVLNNNNKKSSLIK